MRDPFVQGIALFGIVIVGLLFLVEARRWRSLLSVISPRQRTLRTWLVILIEILFVMMFAGPWITDSKHPLTELIYWTVCVLIALAVLVLAFLDIRAVAKGYENMSRQVFGDSRGEDQQEK